MKFLLPALLLGALAGGLCAQGDTAFPSATATGLPTAPILPDRKIRPNDLVGIAVLGQPDLTRTLRVDPEGLIRLPLLQSKPKGHSRRSLRKRSTMSW